MAGGSGEKKPSRISKSERRRLELKGLAVPKDEKALLKGRVYKQEMDNSEERPQTKRWEKVHCALYENAIVYYRDRDATKPLDIISLNEDFLVRKVKGKLEATINGSGRKEIEKELNHIFLLTDFEHINHYFGINSASAKNRWVEKLNEIIGRHQKKAAKAEANRKRRVAFRELQRIGYTKTNFIEGTGMSRSEIRQVAKLSRELQNEYDDREYIQHYKQDWE
mmetsp:Transcript_8297/g.10796  ORF Transcript_8297/g.10796 Transcript_8297/m.10796 type:complete len:223 (-) Transcript_8297:1598-2266(-)